MATLQEKLSEAETAYHEWSIGKVARAFTDQNGERIEYSVEALRRLPSYIADLKRQLGTSPSGPLRVFM